MDKITQSSSLGEARTVVELIRQGYDIFTQLNGKAPFDLIAHKNGQISRVEVKSTNQRARSKTGWIVELRRIRSNKTKNVIHKFDNTKSDIVSVYIEPLDKVILIPSNTITVTGQLQISDSTLDT